MIIDIIAIILMVLGAWMGYRKGAIRSLFQLIGSLAIIIVAYQFKDKISDILIKYLPFFNYGGKLEGLYALNFMVYQTVAFVVSYVLLYCFLNILMELSGLVDLLNRVTIILEKPSKILGAILGVVEYISFIFIVAFALINMGQSQKIVMDSTITKAIMERTPVVNSVFRYGIASAENVYLAIEDYGKTKDSEATNLEIVTIIVKYGVVDANLVNKCIQDGKLHLENVVVAA